MLNRLRRRVRLLARRCPYCARRLVPGAWIPLARGVDRCPAAHYAEADFGLFVAVFDEGGGAIDLESGHLGAAQVA